MTQIVERTAASTRPRPTSAHSSPVAEGLPFQPRVLIVEDERALREGCAGVLQTSGYDVTVTGRGDEALELVRSTRFDIVLLDLYLAPVSGIEILRATLDRHRDTLVIAMTGKPSVESSLEALRAGAWDYLPKPFSANHLQLLLGRATHALAERQHPSPRAESSEQRGHSDKLTLLGISAGVQRAVELARQVARTDAPTFIMGESGTGKSLLAHFIHLHGRRASRAFVPVECSAIHDSDLFGRASAGGHGGQGRTAPGRLASAQGGTLYLAEPQELPSGLQAKLIRALEDGASLMRGGASRAEQTIDVRLISGTSLDGGSAVSSGLLRKELFYRLGVIQIGLPALRERVEDVPVLARHLLLRHWHRHRGQSELPPTFSEDSLALLQSHPWPGNVRELESVVERVAVLSEPGAIIPAEAIPLFQPGQPVADGALYADIIDESYYSARDKVMARFEKAYLPRLFERAKGNAARAARLANVNRTTLYRLMEKHSFRRDDID